MAPAEQKDDGYIRFTCPQCGKRLKIRDIYEGGAVIPCPACQASVVTPMANLEAIAGGAREEDPQWLERMNISPTKLRTALNPPQAGQASEVQGDAQPAPARQGPRLPESPFARIAELDQVAAAIVTMNDKVMGRIQRLYRREDMTGAQRASRVADMARRRRVELLDMFRNKLAIIRRELAPLQANHERLGRSELVRLQGLMCALEAVQLYGRHVCGLDV